MALQRFNANQRLAQPNWLAMPLEAEHIIPGGARVVPSQFPVNEGVRVQVTANAAVAATTIAVQALSGAIPASTTIKFAGTGKFATITVAAARGATSLTVEALPTALVIGDAGFTGTKRGIPQGTLIGRTFSERDAGTGFGPWAAGDEEVYLTVFDLIDANEYDEVDLLRRNCVVKENRLPDWGTLSAGARTAIRSNYQTVLGV